jgi:hypothetical protein
MQIHLLWLAELHRHEASAIFAAGPTAAHENAQHTLPSSGARQVCVVCLIVRQNAARPMATLPLLKPFVASSYCPVRFFFAFDSFQPTLVFGRAPPLS